MSIVFPEAFLERISAYPETVQEALKAPIDRTHLRDYMRVLRGPDALSAGEVEKVLSNPPVTDAFLGRQLVSRAFLARLTALQALLARATADDISTLTSELIAPIADPEAPFLYKLREISTGGGQTAEELRLLAELVEMHHRLKGRAKDAETLVMEDLARAGMGQPVPMLPCLLAALGGVPVLRNAPLPAGLPLAAGTTFIRQLLPTLQPPSLSQADRDTLRFVQRDLAGADGTIRLHRSRPLHVVLEGEGTDIPAAWARPEVTDLIDEVLRPAALLNTTRVKHSAAASLYVPEEQELSPLLLAILRLQGDDMTCIELHAANAAPRSWSHGIDGYLDTAATAPLGRYRAGPDATDTTATLEVASVAQDTDCSLWPDPLLADAYAIVVLLDDAAGQQPFLNLDCCIRLQGLAELQARFQDAPPVVRQKPVVLLGRHTPRQDDYLVNAVQSFWAFSGHYPVTPAQLTYDSDAMCLRAGPADGEGLAHLALADLCTLPLALALELASEETTASRIVFLPEKLIVQTAGNAPMDEAAITVLNRALNDFEISPAHREALFMGSDVTPETLATQSPVLHWPIAHLVRQAARRQSRIDGLLRRFTGHPDSTTANAILAMAGRTSLGVGNAAALNQFALQLSALPQVLAKLEDTAFEAFLMLARQTASADEVAANLSVSTRMICRKSPGLIIPLFELFACTLEDNAMNAALAYGATDPVLKDRALFRVGECMRRYGSEGLLVQHLVYLKDRTSPLLTDPAFLKFFKKLMDHPQPAALEALIGKDTLAQIAATQDFRDIFQRTLMEGDRDQLLALLSDPEHARHVDFTKWMDGLRAFSNELRDLALPISKSILAQTSSLHASRLMSVVFSDTKVLEELAGDGHLDDASDLSLVARNILGDNSALNRMLADRGAVTGIRPIEIQGDTVADVFSNATRSLTGLPKTKGPRVSVVMSAFNADPTLLELSLASILAQTHENLEVFVVDDASQQENSAAIQAICARQRQVIYRRLDVNSGPYIGRNLVLQEATGEFIAIQDADDWSHPQRFETQVAALTETPLLQLATCPHIRIDRAGKVQLEANFTVLGDGPMTSMFRRSVFDTVGPFAAIRSRGDVEMRERIRGYYGSHALIELPQPMMLCLADSATLSQRTKQTSYERLQLFRGNISSRKHLQSARRAGLGLAGAHGILVPRALRPTTEVEG